MKQRGMLALFGLLLVWGASGLFIVRGNERAVVQRFGRVVADDTGRAALLASGLHLDLPWPLSTVRRVNLHEVRTLSVGVATTEEVSDSAFLREFQSADRSQFLTGDKNILHVRADVQYRVLPDRAAQFLFATVDPERRLQQLTEASLSELVTSAAVDSIHTYGRADWQQRFAERLRAAVDVQNVGVEIESVTLDDVRPPLRVKAAFLDVNDARADREKYIQAALAYDQQRQEQARGEARRLLDEAEAERTQQAASARARGESFDRLVAQLQTETSRTGEPYAVIRQRLLRRRFLEDVEQILQKASSKVILETGRQVDVTILREPAP